MELFGGGGNFTEKLIPYSDSDDLVNKEDPTKIYLNSTKIGEGAAGEVFLATDCKTNEQVSIPFLLLMVVTL